MKVNVYNKSGDASGEVELPAVFATEFRPDIIRKAVNAAQANRRQAYGPTRFSGHKPHQSWRSGRGASRVPRATQGGDAVFGPNVVGGRRAHPPRPEHDWSEKINRKEKDLARASALAATAIEEAVRTRGHRFKEGLTLPVVVDDEVAVIAKTKDLTDAFDAIGVGADLERALTGKHVRPGKGKMRGRKYKTPRAFLLVVPDGDTPARHAASNLTGVDVTTPANLSTELVAPGGDPGRLVVVTKAALEQMGGL